MHAVIVYFSMSGRTKKIADIIGKTLSNCTIEHIPLVLTGGFFTKIDKLDKFEHQNFTLFEKELKRLETLQADLLLIGMPTYGGIPPKIFEEILRKIPYLAGKKIVTFSTSWGSKEGAAFHMKTRIAQLGGQILESKNFQGFFHLNKLDAEKFGQKINELIMLHP